MKRLFAFLFIAIYLLSATGVSAQQFYCCGKFVSTTLSLGDDQSTNSPILKDCKMQLEMKDCCKNTKKSFKINDRHFRSGESSSFKANDFFAILLVPDINYNTIGAQRDITITTPIHAPPQSRPQPVYLLNCTYRI